MATSSIVTESGVRLSSPVYVSYSAPEAKQQLNTLRQVLNADPTPLATRGGGISVLTSHKSRIQFNAEQALGMSVDVLRQQLLSSRSSLNLEQALILQGLTGIEQFTRKDLEKSFKAFLDACFASAETKVNLIKADAQK